LLVDPIGHTRGVWLRLKLDASRRTFRSSSCDSGLDHGTHGDRIRPSFRGFGCHYNRPHRARDGLDCVGSESRRTQLRLPLRCHVGLTGADRNAATARVNRDGLGGVDDLRFEDCQLRRALTGVDFDDRVLGNGFLDGGLEVRDARRGLIAPWSAIAGRVLAVGRRLPDRGRLGLKFGGRVNVGSCGYFSDRLDPGRRGARRRRANGYRRWMGRDGRYHRWHFRGVRDAITLLLRRWQGWGVLCGVSFGRQRGRTWDLRHHDAL
jgi:hypothetical protein